MRINKQDILDVLGVSYKEDAFTNILKFLFDSNNDFRRSFIDFFGGNLHNLDNYVLKTRKKYRNSIPDIVICNSVNMDLYVIEVKLFSKEGDEQLSRYKKDFDNIYEEEYGVNSENTEKKLFYLTIDDYKDIKDVHLIYWKDLYPHIKNIEMKKDSIEEICLRALLVRLKPLVNIPELTFNNMISSIGWLKNYMILEKFIASNIPGLSSISGYSGFEKNNGGNTLTIILRENKTWISDLDMKSIGKDKKVKTLFKECYDFHIEIEVYLKNDCIKTVYRFDLHSNSYADRPKVNDVEDRSVNYFSDRLKFITDIKDKESTTKGKYPYVDISINSKYKYNSKIKNYLYIFKTEKEYSLENFKHFESDLIETINEMIPLCNEVVKSFHSLENH